VKFGRLLPIFLEGAEPLSGHRVKGGEAIVGDGPEGRP
jgi:hypothetical protein